ncbi:MAG TPA: hypothetical protein VF945_16280 [Polyangia bacterium]
MRARATVSTVAGFLLAAAVARGEPKTAKPLLPPPPKADDSLAPARLDAALLDRSYKRARNTRNLGIGLAAPGVALSVLGGVLIGFGSTSPNLFDQVDKIIAGVVTGGAGLVIGIPGVYFWSTGQDDMDSVVWRRRQLLTSSPP